MWDNKYDDWIIIIICIIIGIVIGIIFNLGITYHGLNSNIITKKIYFNKSDGTCMRFIVKPIQYEHNYTHP